MPLIRRDRAQQPPTAPPASLDSTDPNQRWAAARALAGDPSAVGQLDAALRRETDRRVQEAILTGLIKIGSVECAGALAVHLRSTDVGLRSGAIEALQAMPDAAAAVLPALLADPDRHVRTRSVEIARTVAPERATELLSPILEQDPDENVCAAAIDVLTENGTPEAVPSLRACAQRFSGVAFLTFAANIALRRFAEKG